MGGRPPIVFSDIIHKFTLYATSLRLLVYSFILSNANLILACVSFIVVVYFNIGTAYAMEPPIGDLNKVNDDIEYWQDQLIMYQDYLARVKHTIATQGENAELLKDLEQAKVGVKENQANVSSSIKEKGQILRAAELQTESSVAGSKRNASRFGDGKNYTDKKR